MANAVPTLSGILTSWATVFQQAENTAIATGAPPIPPISQGLISFAQSAPAIPLPGIGGQAGFPFPFPFPTQAPITQQRPQARPSILTVGF